MVSVESGSHYPLNCLGVSNQLSSHLLFHDIDFGIKDQFLPEMILKAKH